MSDQLSIITEENSSLAIPLNVVSSETEAFILRICAEASKVRVCDPESFKTAAEGMNQLGRARKSVSDAVKERREPFNAALAHISGLGKPLLDAIISAEAQYNAELVVYDRIQKEEAAKAERERQRLAEEARKAQEAADRAREERERLEWEARLREEAAARKVESATTDSEFEAAAADFDKGQELAKQAAAVIIPEVPASVMQAPKAIEVQHVYKPTGTKAKKTAVIVSFDLEKLATVYHMIDEAKVRKAILANIITSKTPGIVFRINESFVGTGRA